MTLYAIIRIRGQADVPPDVRKTLELLRLHKRYHAVIYPADKPGLEGMLQKAKDWITWGEIDFDTLEALLRTRGRVVGDKPLTDKFVEEKLGISGGIKSLTRLLLAGKIEYHKLHGVKPVFRLHPPRGGFKRSVKKQYGNYGELGYRGGAINDLIRRML